MLCAACAQSVIPKNNSSEYIFLDCKYSHGYTKQKFKEKADGLLVKLSINENKGVATALFTGKNLEGKEMRASYDLVVKPFSDRLLLEHGKSDSWAQINMDLSRKTGEMRVSSIPETNPPDWMSCAKN